MRVKRSTVDDVKRKFDQLACLKTPAGLSKPKKREYDYEERIREMEQQQAAEEAAKRAARKTKRQKTLQALSGSELLADTPAAVDKLAADTTAAQPVPANSHKSQSIDEKLSTDESKLKQEETSGNDAVDVAAIMGFGSFGGSRKC